MFWTLIEKAVSYQRSSQYVNVASAALFVTEYLQTFDLEVSLVWGREWTLVKALYAISRYIPFAYLPVALFVGLQDSPTVSRCTSSFATSSILIVTGMMVAEAIMFIRVYALSGHIKVLAAWLLLQFIAVHAAIYAIFALFVKGIKFLPYPIGIPGCIPYRFDTTQLSIVFGIIVASETLIMLITAYIGNGGTALQIVLFWSCFTRMGLYTL